MKIYSLLIALGLSTSSLVAQELASTATPQRPKFTPSRENSLLDGKTAVKMNAFSLILGTLNLSAERILAPGLSGTLSLSYHPSRSENTFEFGHNGFSRKALWELNTLRFTPTLRWYLNGGQGHGFYAEGYYDFIHITPQDQYFRFQTTGQGGSLISAETKTRHHLVTHTWGVSIGAQWLFGRKKNIVLDWCIVGVGSGVGFHSADSWIYPLASSDKVTFDSSGDLHANIKQTTGLSVEDRKITLSEGNTRAHISREKARAYSYRTGLSLGFRF